MWLDTGRETKPFAIGHLTLVIEEPGDCIYSVVRRFNDKFEISNDKSFLLRSVRPTHRRCTNPRCRAVVAACVRSLTPSLLRMLLT